MFRAQRDSGLRCSSSLQALEEGVGCETGSPMWPQAASSDSRPSWPSPLDSVGLAQGVTALDILQAWQCRSTEADRLRMTVRAQDDVIFCLREQLQELHNRLTFLMAKINAVVSESQPQTAFLPEDAELQDDELASENTETHDLMTEAETEKPAGQQQTPDGGSDGGPQSVVCSTKETSTQVKLQKEMCVDCGIQVTLASPRDKTSHKEREQILTALQQEVNEISRQLGEKKRELVACLMEKEDIQASCKVHLRNHEAKMKEKEASVFKLKTRIRTLILGQESLEKQRDQAKAELKQAQEDLAQSKETLRKRELTVGHLREGIKKVNVSNKEKLNQKEDELNQLNNQMKSQSSQVVTLHGRITDLEAQMSRKEEEISRLKDLVKSRQELEAEVGILRMKDKDLVQTVKQLEKEVQEVSNCLSECRRKETMVLDNKTHVRHVMDAIQGKVLLGGYGVWLQDLFWRRKFNLDLVPENPEDEVD